MIFDKLDLLEVFSLKLSNGFEEIKVLCNLEIYVRMQLKNNLSLFYPRFYPQDNGIEFPINYHEVEK